MLLFLHLLVESINASSKPVFNILIICSSESKYLCMCYLSWPLSSLLTTHKFLEPVLLKCSDKAHKYLTTNPILGMAVEICLTECCWGWQSGIAALDHALPPSLHPIYDAHLFAYRKISHGNGVLEVRGWVIGVGNVTVQEGNHNKNSLSPFLSNLIH
jgi:hypothetical protein